MIYEKYKIKRIIYISCLFLILSITPASQRLINNIMNNNTYSLTSQTGSHLLYFVVPGVLSVASNYDREKAIKYVNGKITLPPQNNSYDNSKLMSKVAYKILFNQNLSDLLYAWTRASAINLISSSILLDKKIRSLHHPSFYENGKIFDWLKSMYSNDTYKKYFIFLVVSFWTSFFTLVSIFIGSYVLMRKSPVILFFSLSGLIYFSLITGPIVSPKYALPYLPIILLLQGITLQKIYSLRYFKKLFSFSFVT